MGLRTRLRDLVKSADEHEADEIRARSSAARGDDRTEVRDREEAVIRGTVRSVTMPPRRSVPLLVAEVFDGDTRVSLIWIGRRRIPGVEPGVFLTARGRIATTRLGPTIYNPAYEIVPPS